MVAMRLRTSIAEVSQGGRSAAGFFADDKDIRLRMIDLIDLRRPGSGKRRGDGLRLFHDLDFAASPVASAGSGSVAKLSDALGVAHGTVENRLDRLIEVGTLLGIDRSVAP